MRDARYRAASSRSRASVAHKRALDSGRSHGVCVRAKARARRAAPAISRALKRATGRRALSARAVHHPPRAASVAEITRHPGRRAPLTRHLRRRRGRGRSCFARKLRHRRDACCTQRCSCCVDRQMTRRVKQSSHDRMNRVLGALCRSSASERHTLAKPRSDTHTHCSKSRAPAPAQATHTTSRILSSSLSLYWYAPAAASAAGSKQRAKRWASSPQSPGTRSTRRCCT